MSNNKRDDYVLGELKDLREVVQENSKTTQELTTSIAEHRVALDSINKKDELMYQEFKRMNDILQDNTESLKEHMLRTSLLEEAVVKIDNRLQPIEVEKIEKEAVKKAAKSFVLLAAKVAGGIGAVVALLATLNII